MSTKAAAVLLFEIIERDDIHFGEKLQAHGYRTYMIGSIQTRTSYSFTPRRVGENITKNSDLSLTEALDMDPFDVLIIPGGVGAMSVEDVDGVRQLIAKARKVVAIGYGATLLATTSELDGKNATVDDHFFFGEALSRWPGVNWERDPPIVSDGKFITSKYGEHDAILPFLVAEEATVTNASRNAPSHAIDQLPTEQLTHWQALVKRLRDHAKNLGEASDVPIDTQVLAAYPFLRGPANPTAITTAEARLGVPLPQDYRDFLSVTNGTGFSGIGSIPGLIAVEDLAWQSTETAETGLDSLTELFELPELEDLTPQERTALPALQRVVIISDPDEEEIVGMFDPGYIRRAIRTVQELRQLPLGYEEAASWITFLFVPYAASYRQFESFEGYVESRLR